MQELKVYAASRAKGPLPCPVSKVNDALERLRSGKARYRIVLVNELPKSRSADEPRSNKQPEAALIQT